MQITLKPESYAKFEQQAKEKGMSTRDLGAEILEKHIAQ